MKSALDQFKKGSTTIVQSKIEYQPESPILIACTDPPFKASFFNDRGINEQGIVAAYWIYYNSLGLPSLRNYSSNLDLYMDMSYHLGIDWEIVVVNRKL